MNAQARSLMISPNEYFHTKLAAASHTLRVYLGDEMEVYLVNLLCDFIAPTKINAEAGNDVLETPLVFLMQKAHESENADDKIRIFRRLGDTTLYIAGYFQDYFNRKTFDISYYMDMGSMAYRFVSQLMHGRKDASSVYNDLAENFQQIVDLVAEISDEPGVRQDNRNLLAIYDRWTKSHSGRLRRILEEEGITPLPINQKMAQ